MICKLCLKEDNFCTCIGAEKKHKTDSKPLPKVSPPEDKITEESEPKNLDLAPQEESVIPSGFFHKKKKAKK